MWHRTYVLSWKTHCLRKEWRVDARNNILQVYFFSLLGFTSHRFYFSQFTSHRLNAATLIDNSGGVFLTARLKATWRSGLAATKQALTLIKAVFRGGSSGSSLTWLRTFWPQKRQQQFLVEVSHDWMFWAQTGQQWVLVEVSRDWMFSTWSSRLDLDLRQMTQNDFFKVGLS